MQIRKQRISELWGWFLLLTHWCFPGGSDVKESACNTGALSSIPESGRPPGEGNCYPLQYSWLEHSMDRGTWLATVHYDNLQIQIPLPPNEMGNEIILKISCVCAQLLSRIWLFVTPWTVTLSPGGSSWPRDRARISCIGRQILYHCITGETLWCLKTLLQCDYLSGRLRKSPGCQVTGIAEITHALQQSRMTLPVLPNPQCPWHVTLWLCWGP